MLLINVNYLLIIATRIATRKFGLLIEYIHWLTYDYYPPEFLMAYHLDLEVGVAEIKKYGNVCGGVPDSHFRLGKKTLES